MERVAKETMEGKKGGKKGSKGGKLDWYGDKDKGVQWKHRQR